MENSPSKIKFALNYGAMLGLVLMILSMLTYIFELYDASWMQWLSYSATIGGIVIGIKNYRDTQLNGYITYGSALGYGVLISFFAAIVTSFVNFLYLKFIDDGFLVYSLEAAEYAMYEQNIPEESMEMAMSIQRKMLSPAGIGIIGVFVTTLFGFIISLIAAAFLKKESDTFEDAA